jgi:hypothetical protein
MMRLNAFREVWVKSRESQRISALFTARNTVQDQLIRIELLGDVPPIVELGGASVAGW